MKQKEKIKYPVFTVLLIEDNPRDTQLIQEMFSGHRQARFNLVCAKRLSTGLNYLDREKFDVVLVDLTLPDSLGIDIFLRIQAKVPRMPIVVLTSLDDERVALSAVQKGAQDYLVKGHVDSHLLIRAIRYAIQRKRVEERLRASEERYRHLVELSPDTIIIHSQDKIVFVNPAGCKLLGARTSDELVGEPMLSIVHPDYQNIAKKRMQQIIEKGEEIPLMEEKFLGVDGRAIDVEVGSIPFIYQDNPAVQVVVRDITSRKELEKLKDEFVGTVSHELRTPLTSIREAVSQVLDRIHGEITESQEEFLFVCLEDIDRLTRIINDLLDVSKIEAGKIKLQKKLVNLTALAVGVKSIFYSQAKEKGLEIRTIFFKEELEVYVDKDKIIQVFINLVGNALKFTQSGHVGISIADKEGYVECGVFDTGMGIAPEDLPKVFGKFQQFGRVAGPGIKGTGLGLSITKGIIGLHRGKIRVESRLGKGTKFTFTLPKYTTKELFREYVISNLKEAIKRGMPLSILIFDIKNFQTLFKSLGRRKATFLMQGLEGLAKGNLHRKEDVVVKDAGAILVVLPETDKENAFMVAGRLQQIFDEYLSGEKLDKQVEVVYKITNFPEDGGTTQELFTIPGW
ncbi:MAG: PAS domain S-box protein [Candidatus Omnitrophica bacterium]|nr:PAS domain S-box protein [Candidatus Omnitrophota bacterium]